MSRRKKPFALLGPSILGLAVCASLLSIAFLAVEVARDMRLLNSAMSDNVQWTLSQAEVEFLEFYSEVEHNLREETVNLAELRRRFDIFYSRIAILSQGSLYADLRSLNEFSAPLADIRKFLDVQIPLIDGDDATLLAGLPALDEATELVRVDVRRLSNGGLVYFAQRSDLQRESVAKTLWRLAGVTLVLVVALSTLAVYFNIISRQTRRRGRALIEANLRMNTILSTSLDAVIVTDPEGRILEFNAVAERIFGRSFAEVRGGTVGDFLVPDHLRAAHEQGMARMRDTGEFRVVGKGRITMEAQRAGGEVFPVEMALQSAETSDGQIIISFMRDISARKTAEAELVRARDQALAGEKAKAEFLTVMSHEIRTPLNGLLGNLSLLEETSLAAAQRQYVRNMNISGQLLMRHVDSVLDIARFEAGKMTVALAPTHLGSLFQDIVDGQSGHAEANGTVIQWHWIGPRMEWVMADAARLQQVLLNLVGNAIKFTHFGRVSIEVERLTGVAATEPNVEIRVIDTGIGIAEENLTRAFEDFETQDPSPGRMAEGTGLGLGIARRMVRLMGGEIGVESTVGEGSVFWVRLPLAETEHERDPKTGQTPNRSRRGRKVLVVEDNQINRDVVREMLRRDGHLVRTARDGMEGAQMAHADRFDLILMDISMPVMDGLTATRRIREGDGASRDTPIVALSANVLPGDTDRFTASGMDGFLGKPLRRESLRAIMAQKTRGSASDGPEPAAAEDPGLIDAEQHATLREVMDPEAHAALAARFVDEGDALSQWLVGHGQDDPEATADRAHKAAGSAAVFGAAGFRSALAALEQNARAGSVDPHQIAHIAEIWTRTRTALTTPPDGGAPGTGV